MAFLKIKNRAFSTLASGVSDVATSWTLATGEGTKFPTTGDFHVTCEDEIVKCTSRSDDVLTVVREQEGTTKAAHASGKAVELRITVGIIEEIQGKKAIAGWTSGKILKGGGVGSDPSEVSGWEVLSDWLAGSDADYVDFTGLDINTHQFYILISRIIVAGSTATTYFKLYINGDTTDTNYYTQVLYATDTTIAAERPNVPYFCVGKGIDGQRGVLGFCPVIRDPEGYVRWINQYIRDSAANALMAFYGGIKTGTVTNITSIRIAASVSGGLGTGSRITLCKPRSV